MNASEMYKAALEEIVRMAHDESALGERSMCGEPFHRQRPGSDDSCASCGSTWWDLDGNGPAEEGSYALEAIARLALKDADAVPGERSEPPKPDDVLSRVRVVWEAHRGEPLTSDNYYRLVLDLQAVLDPEDS